MFAALAVFLLQQDVIYRGHCMIAVGKAFTVTNNVLSFRVREVNMGLQDLLASRVLL